EHRAGEAVEVGEGGGGGRINVSGQRLAGLLVSALADELAVLHADLAGGAVLLEERGAEAAPGVPKSDLVGRQARRRDDGLGDLVKRLPRRGERLGQLLEPLPGAQPAVRDPRGELRLHLRYLVPGE